MRVRGQGSRCEGTERSLEEIGDGVGKWPYSSFAGWAVCSKECKWCESGNLTRQAYRGSIPLQPEWNRSYSLYTLHLSVIWINYVLV